MTSNQQPASEIASGLTAGEWSALEAVANDGFASSIIGTVIDKGFHLVTHRLVHELKLMDSDDNHDWLTDLGKRVLQAAHATQATVAKPATITAKDFVEQGYAEKVKRGECVVSVTDDPDKSTPIESVLQNPNGTYTAFYGITDAHNWSMWKDVKSLDITWLPATPPAETESTATGQGATGYKNPTLEDYIANYNRYMILSDGNSREKAMLIEEIFRLRTALTAAQEREARLREALEDIADGDKYHKPSTFEEDANQLRSRVRLLAGIAREALVAANGSAATDAGG